MIGLAAAVVLVVGAAVVAGGMAWAAHMNSEAQVKMASIQANATIIAARAAADAQIQQATKQAEADMYRTKTDHEIEKDYLRQEKWMAVRDADEFKDFQLAMNEIDESSIYVADDETAAWGSGPESAYDMGA